MSKKEKFYEYKTIKAGGAFHHLFRESPNDNWLHHNPDGPAIEPIKSGDRSVSKEYYLFGFQKSLEEFKDIKSSREGLPWYKNPSIKAEARF